MDMKKYWFEKGVGSMDEFNLIEDITNFVSSTVEKKEIDNEYYEVEDDYKKIFGHGVPREMLPINISMDKIKDAMKKCIETKTDDLFGILGVEINPDALY